MVRRLYTALVIAVITVAVVAAGTATAFAKDPYATKDGSVDPCKDAKASALCTGKSNSADNPLTGPNGLLYKATRIIATITGIAAVIIMLVASFMYVTAGGDAGKVGEAKKAILYASIGLIVIVVAQSLILYVLSLIK